ncbi:Transcriptional regulator RPN4 [Daldinia childiae]|uniref:Transcriptional regulator RPN4 n=1 Tax=Daldinia childiae TaxID=326645 RepID=UPI001448655E|nr:Transcriptional regulator RPN4 [Daldinia childiae]KAF3070605.1 Transcriptional regulator RPN4 [Daldinia childiae]
MMQMLDHNSYSSRNHQPFQFFPQQTLDGTSSTNNGFNRSTLSTLDTAAAAIAASQRHRTPATSSSQQSFEGGSNSQSLTQVPDLMPSDSWMLHGSQQTPRAAHRFSHQRESSLSSLGSNGPASPYNASTSNPHIAVPDSGNDGYHDIGGGENNYAYSMGKPMMPDNFYANALFNNRDSNITNGNSNNYHNNRNIISGQHMSRDVSSVDGLPNLANQQQHKSRVDRGLAPAPELSIGGGASSARSHPVSVASSVAGDSPATPSFHETEDDCRRSRNGEASIISPFLCDSDPDFDNYLQLFDDAVFHNPQVPKLDRTMTDIYNDELYNPNFTITSASPPPQTQMAMSPSNDLFAQRLQAANSQHLSVVQSPVSSTSRDDQSPFRQGSPYASAINDFPQVGVEQMHIGSARQMNQRLKAERDDKELQQQMARNSAQQQGTPNTISPKDAMLDFNESDDGSNMPLFQPHETSSYSMEPTNNGATHTASRTISQHSSPSFQSMASTPIQAAFNFSMPSNIQMPQQYPFIAHRQQQQRSTPTASTYSRVSSTEASNSEGGDIPSQKPAGSGADGGTYTCTYHGCTLRFETPALLQKHKREGHRQANALSHVRSSPTTTSGMSGNVLNSQAGPHKCERINPSTGKPCNTIFSRPYDLTRHEDTIHNARKQKVRCDLCTEEKTFSRADALTRHYRVCHPDVEFPGKHRRRGGVGI